MIESDIGVDSITRRLLELEYSGIFSAIYQSCWSYYSQNKRYIYLIPRAAIAIYID